MSYNAGGRGIGKDQTRNKYWRRGRILIKERGWITETSLDFLEDSKVDIYAHGKVQRRSTHESIILPINNIY